MDGDIYDQFGEAIDRRLGGLRAEAQRRAAAEPPPLAMFRLWQKNEEPPFGVEEVGSDEEVTQGLRGGSETEEVIIIESDDEEEEERTEPSSVLFEKMKNLLDKMGSAWATQSKCGGVVPTTRDKGETLTPQARLAQAARTRNQAKASTSQESPRGDHEPGRRKEAVEVEDDDDEEEEDERLRRKEDQRAEQRTRKNGIRGEAEPVIQDGPPKKKKYSVRLEEEFDVEKVIDRLLEGHNDLMTLKEILVSAPRLRDELKGRLSRRLVPNVHLDTILPKEAEWAESGTKMDKKCVACGTVDLMVKGSKCAAMVDTGAEMNIIREADAIRFGLDIDRSDCGILHGASCKAMFCGTSSNVLVEVGKVKARACFFIMPDMDHGILLGRPDVKKTYKITEWPVLFHSITDVRSFLGTCGFWRVFVKNFAAKTEHLRKLVRQDQEWVLGKEQEEVVAKMKEEFREGGLVLGAPDYDATEMRPFIVETDAGPTALGGVLIQADMEGKERPLRFESRTLCTTERNYSQFKRETLAVLHCLRIFWNYIFGRRFILRVDPTALAYSLRNYVPSDPTIVRWLTYIWMFNFELERIPGSKNRADGLSRINWDKQEGEAVENTPPVDGFQDQEEDVRLHINKWSPRVPSCVGYPTWQAPKGYERRNELVLKPFKEEDPWGGKDVQWMMELALANSHSLVEDMRTIEEGPGQVKRHEDLMGGIYLLVNTLLQESLDQSGSLSPAGNVNEIPGSQDDEFEEGEIKEAFRAEEYDGIYLELGLLLSCEMRLRDASDRAQMMLQRYLVRDGHLFVRREVGNPRRVVCGRNRQIDVIAALHDGVAGGHRGVQATYAKISELYYWDGMMDMVGKFCRSCVPCQERSRFRQGEPLHPRLEREVGAVVHFDLLFMPLGDQGYNYIFDARDNLSGFVDGRAIRTKTWSVLVSCIEEYYLRYPFVREFVMDRGSEFTCQEVQELLARYGVAASYTTAAHPQANAPVEKGHSTITNLLAKLTEGKPNQWPRYLRAAFFVENITLKRSTKYAPATLWYGRHATFPIESFLKTWRRRDLEVNLSFEELLDIRARQVGAIEERIQEASDQVARSRMHDKARWDQSARVRKVPLTVGDVVLLYDTSLEKQWSRKLDKRWSDFTKTAMPRGGKGTRPPQRPLGASGGYERHGSRQRESTPVYNDGDIELFLDSFWEHARRMGWTVTQAIERLRGAGRFEEPIARIRREGTTRQEVEIRVEELRPSPVGPDGRPICLEIGNASDFIPAFEWFMQEQGIQRDDWMQTLPLWTRKAERPLAMQIRDIARDSESCRAHLREAFRRPELPQPRIERRQRSQRPRDPEPREARPSRGGRKALARREQEPKDEERGAYPECGLGPVEFRRFTEGGLRRSPAHTLGESPASEGPLRELEMHLDISRWRASLQGERHGEQAKEVPREEVPQEEVRGTQRERGLGDEGRRAGKEVIEVEEDTPPQTPAVASSSCPRAPRPGGASTCRATPESYQPEKKMEAEIPKRVDLRTRERVPAGETAEEKRARRTRRIDEIWQERQRLEAAGELPEQQQERQRSEAAGALPGQPPSAPARAPEIPEIWRDFWEQRGEELPSPVRARFGVARKAEERLDRKIKFLTNTTFDRHLLLEGDLVGKKMKEASYEVRLEAMEMEIQELRVLVVSQAAIIESLRQQTQGKADRPESSRQGEQRQPGQGLPGQPSASEPRQEPPMGRVILEPEEAIAQRQAERKAFEFRAPTELVTLPVAAAGPIVPLTVEEGLPPSSSEPAQGSAEGSMGVLLETVHTMREEVSLFSPEQRIEEPLEREMGIEEEGAIEGRLQRIGTPEYGPEEIEEQPTEVPEATLERRPQRLDTPKYIPATEDLRGRLGSWAAGSESGGPVPGIEQQEVASTAAPQAEQQGVVSTLVGSPSSLPPQPRKRKFKRKVDQLCFYCKRDVHLTLDCLEFLEGKAAGKILVVGGKMCDRQGRIVEKSADGLRAQLYSQNQEELRR
ncbi:hypothetical protein CBR_g34961 [Chara braunii]|uniref:RNA-directed DNA polymerase n=1 Tax=Chara braunii TaxID=69332 RepID=A0A388LK41_CHABU|nr:hypothetical protein CBR_g34961 [Chara braunii]|eukprot:GBG82592.1 hypothetical protein CBR_g34961 [Chara braunii]